MAPQQSARPARVDRHAQWSTRENTTIAMAKAARRRAILALAVASSGGAQLQARSPARIIQQAPLSLFQERIARYV